MQRIGSGRKAERVGAFVGTGGWSGRGAGRHWVPPPGSRTWGGQAGTGGLTFPSEGPGPPALCPSPLTGPLTSPASSPSRNSSLPSGSQTPALQDDSAPALEPALRLPPPPPPLHLSSLEAAPTTDLAPSLGGCARAASAASRGAALPGTSARPPLLSCPLHWEHCSRLLALARPFWRHDHLRSPYSPRCVCKTRSISCPSRNQILDYGLSGFPQLGTPA